MGPSWVQTVRGRGVSGPVTGGRGGILWSVTGGRGGVSGPVIRGRRGVSGPVIRGRGGVSWQVTGGRGGVSGPVIGGRGGVSGPVIGGRGGISGSVIEGRGGVQTIGGVRGSVIRLQGPTPSPKRSLRESLLISPVAVKKARTTSSPETEKTELCRLCGEQSVAYRSLKAETLKVEQVRDLLDLDLQADNEAGLTSVICNKCSNFLDMFSTFKRSVIKGQEIIKKKEEADKQRMTVDNR